ncbi:MAG: hypothetical protein R3A44_31645 [Caldilineaceae bacterium]
MIAWKNLPFTQAGLEAYLSDLSGAPVQLQSVRALSGNEENDGIKEYGYGAPLLIEYTLGSGRTEKIVFHTMPADHFGHERASDRARNMLLDHATFNKLPRHAPSLDVGALTPVQQMLSLGAAKEFFHVTRFVPGRLYAPDLDRIAESDRLAAGDLAFVQALADYLAQIHTAKNPDADRYRRCLARFGGARRGYHGHVGQLSRRLCGGVADQADADRAAVRGVALAVERKKVATEPGTRRFSSVEHSAPGGERIYAAGPQPRRMGRTGR